MLQPIDDNIPQERVKVGGATQIHLQHLNGELSSGDLVASQTRHQVLDDLGHARVLDARLQVGQDVPDELDGKVLDLDVLGQEVFVQRQKDGEVIFVFQTPGNLVVLQTVADGVKSVKSVKILFLKILHSCSQSSLLGGSCLL